MKTVEFANTVDPEETAHSVCPQVFWIFNIIQFELKVFLKFCKRKFCNINVVIWYAISMWAVCAKTTSTVYWAYRFLIFSVGQLWGRLANLWSYYCRELKKVTYSKKNGARTDEVFTSKWCSFNILDSFLRAQVIPRSSTNIVSN